MFAMNPLSRWRSHVNSQYDAQSLVGGDYGLQTRGHVCSIHMMLFTR
jgi:hypothetical protein